MNEIIPNISRHEYSEIDAINHSTLKYIRKSPAHYRYFLHNPPESSEAQNFGTKYHQCILEFEKFSEMYLPEIEGDGRTKIIKEARERQRQENPYSSFIPKAELDAFRMMKGAMNGHKRAADLLDKCDHFELALIGKCSTTGLSLKGLLDGLITKKGWIVDLKTAASASPHNFWKAIANFHYYTQAAYYIDLCVQNDIPATRFIWIVQETKAPYFIRCYEASAVMLQYGRMEYKEWLKQLKVCLDSNEWPGWTEDIEIADMPRWKWQELGVEQ